jgi:hypothetical protein
VRAIRCGVAPDESRCPIGVGPGEEEDMRTSFGNRPRRAVTLIEAVLFIAIALSLIVGGLVFFQQASLSRQTQETVRLVGSIVTEARTLFGRAEPPSESAPPADQYLGKTLIASGAIPPKYVGGATGSFASVLQWEKNVISPWNGQVGIKFFVLEEPEDFLPAGTEVLHITLYDIPREVCVRIAQYDTDGNGILGDGIARLGTGRPGRSRYITPGGGPAEASANCKHPDDVGQDIYLEITFHWR